MAVIREFVFRPQVTRGILFNGNIPEIEEFLGVTVTDLHDGSIEIPTPTVGNLRVTPGQFVWEFGALDPMQYQMVGVDAGLYRYRVEPAIEE